MENTDEIIYMQNEDVLDDNIIPTEGGNTEEADPKVSKSNEANKEKKLLRLPMWRVKKIMKIDPDTHLINKEAAFLTTKATELFIGYLSKEMFKHVDGKRKTILKKDFDAAVNDDPNLCFLDGTMGYL